MQIAAGAAGITATLRRVMFAAGIDDILVAYPCQPQVHGSEL